LDEIWYGLIGDYPKIILFDYLLSVIPTWQANQLVRWDQDQHMGGEQKQTKVIPGRHCCAKMMWADISPRMA
jgi:hypothetical protein